MPSDNINATTVATQLHQAPARIYHQASGLALATQAESIPCPRCDSNNTKFCYYNYYNLSQPRHFCKSCHRYWTHGGTLRNIPVDGVARKSISANSSNKRPRCSPATVPYCYSSLALSSHDGVYNNGADSGINRYKGYDRTKQWRRSEVGRGLGLRFFSQLSVSGRNTFLALGGYGPRYGPTYDEVEFEFSRIGEIRYFVKITADNCNVVSTWNKFNIC